MGGSKGGGGGEGRSKGRQEVVRDGGIGRKVEEGTGRGRDGLEEASGGGREGATE